MRAIIDQIDVKRSYPDVMLVAANSSAKLRRAPKSALQANGLNSSRKQRTEQSGRNDLSRVEIGCGECYGKEVKYSQRDLNCSVYSSLTKVCGSSRRAHQLNGRPRTTRRYQDRNDFNRRISSVLGTLPLEEKMRGLSLLTKWVAFCGATRKTANQQPRSFRCRPTVPESPRTCFQLGVECYEGEYAPQVIRLRKTSLIRQHIERCRCGTVLPFENAALGEDWKLCPSCGSRVRAFELITGADVVPIQTSLRLKAKSTGERKPWYESFSRRRLVQEISEPHAKFQIFNCRSDDYYEMVKDPDTGKVTHHCSEPPTQNRNHGSARKT